MINLKLKLIFSPWCHIDPNREEGYAERGFPPLGIATLTAFLRNRSIRVEQDDLEIKSVLHNEKFADSENSIKLGVFADEKKINRLINGGEETLEREGEKILKLTNWKGFDVIGFSLHSTDNPSVVGVVLTLAKLLKEKYGTTIITGDLMDPPALKKILSSGFVDCSIASSHIASLGETNLFKFCKSFEKSGDISNIPGAIYFQNDKVVYTRKLIDYKKEEKSIFTLPDFDGLPMDMYKYTISSEINGSSHTSKILILPYFFIYGCPNKCAFCYYSTRPLTALKPSTEVADELGALSKKYHTRYFFFLNTEINPIKQYAESVANEIIKKDLDIFWTDCASFKNMDSELLQKLGVSGAARLVWGLENPSLRMLKFINKDIAPFHAEGCLKNSDELGIWNQVLLICGFPYEKKEDIDFTISFLEKNKKYIDETTLNKFYIDGLFNDYPENFDIRVDEHTKTYRNWTTKPFDEINGLQWKDKRKLTLNFYNHIWSSLERLKLNMAMPIHVVFHFAALERELNIKIETKKAFDVSKKGLSYKYSSG